MQLFFDDYALIVVSESFTVKKALGHNNKLIVSHAGNAFSPNHACGVSYLLVICDLCTIHSCLFEEEHLDPRQVSKSQHEALATEVKAHAQGQKCYVIIVVVRWKLACTIARETMILWPLCTHLKCNAH